MKVLNAGRLAHALTIGQLIGHVLMSNIYRPHPKDGGRYCFQFVSQSTPRWGGGGVPQPGLNGGGAGVLRPGVDGRGGYPGQVWMVGGTPVRSGWWGGTWNPPGQVWMVGVPRVPPGPDLDYGGTWVPLGQVWMVGGTPLGQVLMVGGTQGTPWARSGL